jgi:hypothetical protein
MADDGERMSEEEKDRKLYPTAMTLAQMDLYAHACDVAMRVEQKAGDKLLASKLRYAKGRMELLRLKAVKGKVHPL